MADDAPQAVAVAAPTTEEELWLWIHHVWGVTLPDRVIRAAADVYFARAPVVVWLASRLMGGKTRTLSTLAATKAVTHGMRANVLGGSGEQARRALEYLHPDSLESLWTSPSAPRYMLPNKRSKTSIKLKNGGVITALNASKRAVHGPHPGLLCIDEADDVPQVILDAAMGQAESKAWPADPTRIVPSCTLISSTRYYDDGTMTEVLKRASTKGWIVHEWTYRDTLLSERNPTGWLSQAQVDEKRQSMTEAQWEAEVENQEPNPGGRAINGAAVARMFHRDEQGWKQVLQDQGLYIFEPYHPTALYSVGADWGKQRDKSVVVVLRIDCHPWRVVAFYRKFKTDWPEMIAGYDGLCEAYHVTHKACHDGTGIGNVIADFAHTQDAEPVLFVGTRRRDMLTEWVKAIEGGLVDSHYVEIMAKEHRHLLNEDIYGGGHPGDTVVAGCMAKRAAARVPEKKLKGGLVF